MKKILSIIYVLFGLLLLILPVNGLINIIAFLSDDLHQPAYIFGYSLAYTIVLILALWLIIKGVRTIIRLRKY